MFTAHDVDAHLVLKVHVGNISSVRHLYEHYLNSLTFTDKKLARNVVIKFVEDKQGIVKR